MILILSILTALKLIPDLIEKSTSYAKDQYKWFKGPDESLEQITQSQTRIQATIEEVKRHGLKDEHQESWLQQLNDGIQDIDGMLDLFAYLGLKPDILSTAGRLAARAVGLDDPVNKLKELLVKLKDTERSSQDLLQVVKDYRSGSTISGPTTGPGVEHDALDSRLPQHLQRCLAYCSVFSSFDPKMIVEMWIAQGYIKLEEGDVKSFEDLGFEYFEKLKSMSLLVPDLDRGKRTTYKINNTIPYLQEITKECMRLEGNARPKTNTRHLSVTTDRLPELENWPHLKRLSTLVVITTDQPPLEKIPEGLLEKLKSVRVLDLSRSGVIDLSESVGNLISLRYLALSKPLNIVPRSVDNLLLLQTLYVPRKCNITELPKGLNNLVNLRHLDAETKFIAGISGIRRMKNLNCSVEFHVKSDEGHKLQELKDINDIGPKLSIKNLENVAGKEEARKAELKDKARVKILSMVWSPGRIPANIAAEFDVLEAFELPKLTELHITGYAATSLPTWLTKLGSISLTKCRWKKLPPLGQLLGLKVLRIKELDEVEKIDPDFYGRGEEAFPNLEMLEFHSMPHLREWSLGANRFLFPRLKRLIISNCPELKQVPTVPATVRKMEVAGSLNILHFKLESPRSGDISLETSSLSIIRRLLHEEHVKAIKILTIRQSEETVLTTEDLTDMNSLMELCVMACPRIKSIALVEEQSSLSLQKLRIEGCEKLSSLAVVEHTPSLQTLEVVRCPKFTSASLPPNLKHLSSLKNFTITHCPEFRSLPDGGLPSSLKSFRLVGCHQNLTRSLLLRRGTDYPKISFIPDVVIQ